MGGFNTLFLIPAESPGPWSVVAVPVAKRKKHWSGGMKTHRSVRYEVHDAEGMFVAEVENEHAANAIVHAVNKLYREEVEEGS